MLARYVIECLSAVSASVVTRRYCIETAERMGLIFRVGASFTVSYTVFKENPSNSKDKDIYFRLELCPKL